MLKRSLSAQVRLWHVLLVSALIAVSSSTALAGERVSSTNDASNLSPAAFFTPGAFSMAAAYSQTSITVHSVDGEVEVLRASFSVPAGKQAEVAAFFNAEAFKYKNGYCYLKFYLDAIAPRAGLRPGRLWVADGYVYAGAYPTISAQGYQVSVGPGDHAVIVAVNTTGGDCYLDNRSLILISNGH